MLAEACRILKKGFYGQNIQEKSASRQFIVLKYPCFFLKYVLVYGMHNSLIMGRIGLYAYSLPGIVCNLRLLMVRYPD